ncbi:hypothetical protein AB0917_16065, partial [Streptomyces sp. NPDC007346]
MPGLLRDYFVVLPDSVAGHAVAGQLPAPETTAPHATTPDATTPVTTPPDAAEVARGVGDVLTVA